YTSTQHLLPQFTHIRKPGWYEAIRGKARMLSSNEHSTAVVEGSMLVVCRSLNI
ncbi:unnamed protein product, partial [Ceratitis capitata]